MEKNMKWSVRVGADLDMFYRSLAEAKGYKLTEILEEVLRDNMNRVIGVMKRKKKEVLNGNDGNDIQGDDVQSE
jgi:hypothetical protein